MAPVPPIAPAITRLLRSYKGAQLTLQLPSKALRDIGKSNPNKFGTALREIATRYPKATTTITGEVGDKFIRVNAAVQNGDNILGEIQFNGNAGILDALRNAFLKRPLPAVEKINPRDIRNGNTFVKTVVGKELPKGPKTPFHVGDDPQIKKIFEGLIPKK